MRLKTSYYYKKNLERLKLGKGFLLALPLSVLMWVIILVILF